MAGEFDSIKSLLSNLGLNIKNLVGDQNFMYGLYFVAFFMGIFSIINAILQKMPAMQGKPGKVVSTFISIISTGGIFFQYRNHPGGVVGAFNSFGFFIVSLIIGVGILWFCFERYKASKEAKYKTFWISLGLLFFSSITKDYFLSGSQGIIVEKIPALSIIGSSLNLVYGVSGLLFLISVVTLILGIFGKGAASNKYTKYLGERFKEEGELLFETKTLVGRIKKNAQKVNDLYSDLRGINRN